MTMETLAPDSLIQTTGGCAPVCPMPVPACGPAFAPAYYPAMRPQYMMSPRAAGWGYSPYSAAGAWWPGRSARWFR
jgi:hypothetical protein